MNTLQHRVADIVCNCLILFPLSQSFQHFTPLLTLLCEHFSQLVLCFQLVFLRTQIARSENMLHQQELLATMQLSSFQKVGLVRYDAFDDTGDKLSFSLTVLDGKNNGFILSSLAGHDTSRIYAKQIVNGQCKEALSSEEAESINMALDTLMPDMASEAQELVNETRGEALAKSQPDNHRIDTAGK